MPRWYLLLVLAVVCLLLPGVATPADGPSMPGVRFFHSGDGRLNLKSNKSSAVFVGRYRNDTGHYDSQAYSAICRVFGAPCASNRSLSLRLIEFIDAVADHFSPGASITITSGYRAPNYNRSLREKGRLAAKASLHQYGMAADLIIDGVPSRRIWEHVKSLGFGGAGYYHGKTVHIDVGPARSWDEKSSGVGTGISDDNKLIGLVTDYDVYSAGAPLVLRFIRMTAFPVGVGQQFTLYRQSGNGLDPMPVPFTPAFAVAAADPCVQFGDIVAMDGIRWRLPPGLPAGYYTIGARFCSTLRPRMPKAVTTPVFQVIGSE